jgi:hypothetical protein
MGAYVDDQKCPKGFATMFIMKKGSLGMSWIIIFGFEESKEEEATSNLAKPAWPASLTGQAYSLHQRLCPARPAAHP